VRMSHAIWIGASFSLAACQTTGGSGCPPLVTYSAETQRQAAQELRSLPKDSQLAKLVVDYGKVRRACRHKD
jgi:hypothetical protein